LSFYALNSCWRITFYRIAHDKFWHSH